MSSQPTPTTTTFRPYSTSHSILSKIIHTHRPALESYRTLYKHIHSNPELSTQETATAALVASHLRSLSSSLSIHESIGGTGLCGVLHNGSGQTVLLRADMDALPVEEKTGLPYASTKTMKDTDGITKPVMHACGHDMHVTSLLAAAELLISALDTWSGTIIFLFQPAEERGSGARAMVSDDLYKKIPIPDIVLGQHVIPYKAGVLGTRRGLMASAAESFKVTVYGRGGHASQPHRTVDPVVIAASIVLKLQTIVSREVPPDEAAVVTVGAVQAGMTENIIADSAELKINVRNVSQEWRERVLAAVKRIVRAECEASNSPKDPLFEPTSNFPFTINDDAATIPLEEPFAAHFGNKYLRKMPRLPGSEDFSILATSVKKPASFWCVGCTDPEKWDEAERKGRIHEDVPVNHSPFFAPVIEPTLTASVDALALGALVWLAK